jgi:putative spermidine/putrescine transport system permease protein
MTALTKVEPARRPAPRPRSSRTGWPFLLLPAGVLLGACFVYPLLAIFARSFTEPRPGLDNYRQLWDSAVFHVVLGRTFTTAALVCLVCLAFGYPYAYLMTIAGRRWRGVMLLVVLVPFWTSLMVRTFSWLVLLQDNGLVNDTLNAVGAGRLPLIRNTTGVTIGMAQVMLPFAVLPMYAVMQRIDRRLLDAAANCGARPVAAFARIYVPQSIPGVMAGMSLVFILSLGFFITPQILGSPSNALLSQLLYTEVTQLGNWGYGAAMGFVLLVTAVMILVVIQGVTRVLGPGVAGRGSAS